MAKFLETFNGSSGSGAATTRRGTVTTGRRQGTTGRTAPRQGGPGFFTRAARAVGRGVGTAFGAVRRGFRQGTAIGGR